MKWNWQKNDWRKFTYDIVKIQHFEDKFSRLCGEMVGALKHLASEEKDELRVTLLRDEAIQTSKIEGEYLDRDSIQSSIQRHFGLQVDKENKSLKEQGISDLLIDVYQNFSKPLTHDMLKVWQKKLFSSATSTGEQGQ